MTAPFRPLTVLVKIFFIGFLWSFFFFEGIRAILITNWHFDIIRPTHWQYAWNLWNEGWVIEDAKEWAFVLIITCSIPLWLASWAALSLIPLEKYINWILTLPKRVFRSPRAKRYHEIKARGPKPQTIAKKKSYKEIRPRNPQMPAQSAVSEPISNISAPPSQSQKPITTPVITKPMPQKPAPITTTAAQKSATSEAPKNFDHSLFKFDNDEDNDFDFNFDNFDEKPKQEEKKNTPPPVTKPSASAKPQNNNSNSNGNGKNKKENTNNNGNRNQNKPSPNNAKQAVAPSPPENRPAGHTVLDIITNKGYEVITGITVKNNFIDFVGLGDRELIIFLCDKDPGDWLADEERFNDEEPLWFSENSHRISPVRKIDIARHAIKNKLAENNISLDIKAYIIIQLGNIINAEDMFEIWRDMDIKVTRIDRGSPKEIHLFSKSLEESSDPITKEKFEKIKKLIRNI